MNLVSLLTFSAGLIYVYLGYFGIKIDFRARLNQIFFLLCLACAWWAFCIAFMFPAADAGTALHFLKLSSPGWCIGPALILHFTLYLTTKEHRLYKNLLTYLIYIPSLVFTVIGLTKGVTSRAVVLKSFGWDNIPFNSTPEYWAYILFSFSCIGLSIILLIKWGRSSQSRREKEQARILAIFSFLGLLLAALNESILPLLGVTNFPKVPVVMWLCWAYGMWYAISKYRFLILTPEIATPAIVASITDMMIMLNPQGQITLANQSIQTLLGYRYEELYNQPADLIFADKTGLKKALELMRSGHFSNMKIELDYQSKSGEKIPVMLSCSAIRDSFEELAGMVIVAQDLRPTRLLELQNEELEAITNDLLDANKVLEKKSLQIKNILDHVGQGFLSFGPDLLIDEEYSQECNQIFLGSPARKTLAELLYPDDSEQADVMNLILHRLFDTSDNDKIALYIPLLPSEAALNNRSISLEFQIINDLKTNQPTYILCILTDITEKRLLEENMEKERTILQMVVKVIIYYDTFMECIEDFSDFSSRKIYEIIDGPESLDKKMAEIFRYIHTFKGNFSQFDTTSIVKKLHQIETLIQKINNAEQAINPDQIKASLTELKMNEWLNDDLDVISEFLGKDFLKNKNTYNIEKEKLLDLEQKMAILMPHKEYALLLPYIRKLRYKPFKEMLKSYPEYVLQMAERLGKNINPFTIEGDNPLVDNEHFHFFARSLVHVFRNMVDHGIEYADERLMLGKNETGCIRCRLECSDDCITIIVADDGSGIDTDLLKTKAIASEKYSRSELESYTEKQLIELIFDEQLSTSENISLISGRGVGLAVVKSETEHIDGKILVNSIPGKGTEYIFQLPIPDLSEIPLFSIPKVLVSIIKTIQDTTHHCLGIDLTNDMNISSAEKVFLNKYTAMIHIRGAIDGFILMSYNENLAKELAHIFISDDIVIEDDPEILEDLTAEATNIILGNSLKNLGEFEDLVRIGIPAVTINHNKSIIKQFNSEIYTCSIDKDNYTVTCSFIPL